MANSRSRVLGLDIGSNSVGWALIEEKNNKPQGIVGLGDRIFEEGMNLDAKSGLTESRNVKRREARLRRRQVTRHTQRKRNVHRLLANSGLLPKSRPAHTDAAWQPILDSNPYELRAKALNSKVSHQELGRIFYHLAERRGFLSNRKRPLTKEEHGIVKDGIKKLGAEMDASHAQTIGEYFSRLNPHEVRIRTHYTQRSWYIDEFVKIWEKQASFYPALLTDKARHDLYQALFDQRPLLIRKGLIGYCELDPRRRRAPLALLSTQEFRLLQELNNLRIDDGSSVGVELTQEQRQAIYELQQKETKVRFSAIRKLPPLKGLRFNLERGDRKDMSGNRTAAFLRNAIGAELWDSFDEQKRGRLVNDLLSISSDTALRKRLAAHWQFDEAAVELLGETTLEDGYGNLSSSAILKLLPHMREGKTYREAVDLVEWNTKPFAQEATLPPLENLRNPTVQRSLAEMRRVMNAIIRLYGRPDKIRIELARELKQNKEDRAEGIKRMRAREAEREEARAELLKYNLPNPRGSDIEKWLLHKECGGRCPYTGKQIGFDQLFRTNEFDVEHILPFSRSFDNSFANKTLCHVTANRVEKRNQTPFETYGDTPDWKNICARVKKFTGEYAKEKFRRFCIEDLSAEAEFLEGFTHRQLNDTKYASVRAAKYLRILYPEQDRLSAVQATSGRVTAYLRNAWDLNKILSDGPRKSRDDHRHHAVDALCVALTKAGVIQQLSNESALWADRKGRVGVFRNIPPPWEGFYEDAKRAVENIVTSHRTSRKVQGQLHQETHYGEITDPYATDKKQKRTAVLRVRVEELEAGNIAQIIDPAIRRAVEERLGGEAPKKVFKSKENLPLLKTKAGSHIPIKRVRIRLGEKALLSLGETRKVVGGNNHHLEIYETKNARGNSLWKGRVVSMMEALQRKRAGLPAVARTDENNCPLLFSLVRGDVIRCTYKSKRELFKITGISEGEYAAVRVNDARPATVIRKIPGERIRFRDSTLEQGKAEKLSLDPLGNHHITRD